MTRETILVDNADDVLTITLNRLDKNNALNDVLMSELQQTIDTADDKIKIIVLQGQQGIFSTGMDLTLFANPNQPFDAHKAHEFSSQYMTLLTTFATTNKIMVAKLDGKVMAGGIGLVAAADLVFASPRTTFCLSEALWGLLPANVMPFLIRRIGFQTAYRLTITTETVSAQFAKECHLVDDILTQIDDELSAKLIRIRRLQKETIADLKGYFNHMHCISEDNRQHAINTLAQLIVKPRVQENIINYVQHNQLPWR